MSQLEILAPAGSREALTAAVRCGADAVYLGGQALNARRSAENFDSGQLREAVEYCHMRGVKVYLTVNTLAFDQEFPELEKMLDAACKAGVDGCIAQDLGVASYIRRAAPRMPLHGSTQMSVHSLDGAKELEALGFSRVVLARELSAVEIEAIAGHTSLQIECFVHGALCYCVSGQCLMSAVLGGRSGNRGLCAQPCRLPFGSGGQSYSLSLKDLTLISRIPQMREIGVASLKIEGRMKRPEYVAAAVTACRNALEGRPVDFETLQAVFSRSGFTSGYFDGKPGPGMKGIRQKEDVTAAAPVFKKLASLYKEERQAIAVDMRLILKEGEPAVLTVEDREGHAVQAEGDIPQTARTAPTDRNKAETALGKLGGTIYRLERLDCRIDPGLMTPVSNLNAMRREAVEKMDRLRRKTPSISFTPPPFKRSEKRKPPSGAPPLWARIDRAEQLTSAMLEACERIVIPARIFPGLSRELIMERGDRLMIEIPSVLFEGRDRLSAIIKEAGKWGIRHAMAGSLDAAGIGKRHGLILHGGPSLNITNRMALEIYAGFLQDTVVSAELRLSQAKDLSGPLPIGVFAYGRLPLMVSRVCPLDREMDCGSCGDGFGVLVDRKANRFPVKCQWGCSVIWNTVPLYMADRLQELEGLDFLFLYFTDESGHDCDRILREYVRGGTMEEKKTRGLFYRGVR